MVERATAELIAAEVPARILEQVLEGQVVDEVVTRLLADDSLERTVETLLTRWFEGPLYDEVVNRVLASAELWRLVARSPTARR